MTLAWFKQEEETLAQRASRAGAVLESALSTFTNLADDLEAAVVLHEAVISDANDEIGRLTTIQATAQAKADRAATAADNIRQLVG